MQLFQQPFDASTVKPQEAFEPVPEGWYILAIRNSEAKPTKDNESGYLVLELEVLEGEHKGRKVFDNLNLWNKSVQASEIAQRQLSAYCHATGVLVLNDSTQLHGIPLKAKLGIKADPGYDPRNVVKTVKHIQEPTPGAQQPATPPFGQNPSLPAIPAPMPQAPSGFAPQPAPFAAPSMPPQQQQPANNPPWSQPVQQPQQPAPQQFPPTQQFAPQVPAQAPTFPPQQAPVASSPVPPWRR